MTHSHQPGEQTEFGPKHGEKKGMRIRIDPTVDCVFKAILGTQQNSDLTVHFLNAMLGYQGADMITGVMIKNTELSKEYLNQKQIIPDIYAVDQLNRHYQIEYQLTNYRGLEERIAHNHARLKSSSSEKGVNYKDMTPVISIWLLNKNLFPKTGRSQVRLEWADYDAEFILNGKSQIHLFQLRNLETDDKIKGEKRRWLRFFKEAKNHDPSNLPEWMSTPEMRKAMSIAEAFNIDPDKLLGYYIAQDRRMEAATIQSELDEYEKLKKFTRQETRLKLEAEQRAEQNAQRAEQNAQRAAESERKSETYRALLEKMGVDLSGL